MDKTIEQIKRAHQGDKTAREALVKDNLGLVWSIVRRFAGRGCDGGLISDRKYRAVEGD